MYKFRWKGSDVLGLLAEAERASSPAARTKEFAATAAAPSPPPVAASKILWVCGEGVYLRSDFNSAERSLVFYAEGHDPARDDLPELMIELGFREYIMVADILALGGGEIRPSDVLETTLDPEAINYTVGLERIAPAVKQGREPK